MSVQIQVDGSASFSRDFDEIREVCYPANAAISEGADRGSSLALQNLSPAQSANLRWLPTMWHWSACVLWQKFLQRRSTVVLLMKINRFCQCNEACTLGNRLNSNMKAVHEQL